MKRCKTCRHFEPLITDDMYTPVTEEEIVAVWDEVDTDLSLEAERIGEQVVFTCRDEAGDWVFGPVSTSVIGVTPTFVRMYAKRMQEEYESSSQASTTDMERCKTCKHWEEEGKVGIHHIKESLGRCTNRTVNAYANGDFMTLEDFGCTEHEPREDDD